MTGGQPERAFWLARLAADDTIRFVGEFRGDTALGDAQAAQRRRGGYILEVLDWKTDNPEDDEDGLRRGGLPETGS